MAKVFAVLGIALILSGIILLAVPREQAAGPAARSAAPGVGIQAKDAVPVVSTLRNLAEQANAPLSILFGLMSLYYTRRTYLNSRKDGG